jgi:CRISPR-associated Csx3 family protein
MKVVAVTLDGIFRVEDLERLHEIEKELLILQPAAVDGVAISGRAPIWMYGAIIHTVSHLARRVWAFDPKIGFVTVCNHVSSNERRVYEQPELIVIKEIAFRGSG